MRLLLIRHGQTLSNVRHLLDTGFPGPPLTELGEQQAVALVAALAAQPIDLIGASTLRRAQQTAQPLATARGLDVLVRDGIREIAAGELEMRDDKAAAELYVQTMFAWAAGDLDRRLPGGQDGASMLAGYDQVIAEVQTMLAPDGTAALISHGAAIRTWVAARASNLEPDFAAAHPLANTAIVALDGHSDGWTVTSWDGRSVTGQPADPADPAAAVPDPDDGEAQDGRR